MSKPPPTPEVSHRRASLKKMVQRGTRHERDVAAAKLGQLEARYDFSAVSDETREDLFQMCSNIHTGCEDSVPVISIAGGDEEIGSYVKWAFLHKFEVDSYWKRNISGTSTLHANVDKTAADSLRAVAKIMLSRFKQLWTQYRERNTLRAEERRPFYCGFYDGMMQSPRSPGEKVPMFSGPRRKKKKEKKELVFSVENHPYEIGIALGGMIRANTPQRTLDAAAIGNLRALGVCGSRRRNRCAVLISGRYWP